MKVDLAAVNFSVVVPAICVGSFGRSEKVRNKEEKMETVIKNKEIEKTEKRGEEGEKWNNG